jgi:hypothetical protein
LMRILNNLIFPITPGKLKLNIHAALNKSS